MQRVLQTEGGAAGGQDVQRCGPFGKKTGTFWWPATVRGTQKRFVAKQYDVGPMGAQHGRALTLGRRRPARHALRTRRRHAIGYGAGGGGSTHGTEERWLRPSLGR